MSSSREFYDDLETRPAEEREQAQFTALPAQVAHARTNTPYFSKLLSAVDPAAVTDREALAVLPITRKSDLSEFQKKSLPLAGMTSVPAGQLHRIFQSPGPTYDAEGAVPDYWRLARAFFAAGFRAGDIVHNAFAYHFTPAGVMVETAAHALGCAVFPAGTGQTELQVRAIADVRPTGYGGTPSFLKIILEKGREMGEDLSSMTKAVVAGEALPPSLREDIRSFGVNVLQCYAIADVGLVAYESGALDGLIVDEGVIVEIVRPGTSEPVPDGDVGEVVVTTFSQAYPLIRFATGDLSAVLAGESPCGRTNMRLKGWLGRADQSTKVRGMFVHPAQVAEVLKRHPAITKARLVVTTEDGRDEMTLHCETKGEPDTDAITETVQAVCKLRGRVALVPTGSLANDGKVIEDARAYD